MKKAKNMEELESLILRQMQDAMQVVHIKSYADTKEEVASFYSKGSPTIYRRTGKLKNSVKNYRVSRTGKALHFYIWLDMSYTYVMPNQAFIERGYSSYFTTPMVFEAAEAGTANIKGKSGFWARSKIRIQSDLDNTFAKFFK